MTNQEARARVAKGAALLDQKRPGWAEKIDTGKLRMEHACFCILGQLEGSFWTAAANWFHEEPYHSLLESSQSTMCGFSAAIAINQHVPSDDTWSALKDAWLDAIAERVTPAPVVEWQHREDVTA